MVRIYDKCVDTGLVLDRVITKLVVQIKSKTRHRAQSDVFDHFVGGITAVNNALDLCVSEPHRTGRKAVGNAGVNGVVITYVTASRRYYIKAGAPLLAMAALRSRCGHHI